MAEVKTHTYTLDVTPPPGTEKGQATFMDMSSAASYQYIIGNSRDPDQQVMQSAKFNPRTIGDKDRILLEVNGAVKGEATGAQIREGDKHQAPFENYVQNAVLGNNGGNKMHERDTNMGEYVRKEELVQKARKAIQHGHSDIKPHPHQGHDAQPPKQIPRSNPRISQL